MFVTYKPEDGDVQRWRFDPGRVRASKAEMIEKRFGQNWDVWLANVQSGSMKARRVLLWHLLTLAHNGLRFEDVPDFFADELLVEHSVDELTEIRDRVAKSTKIPEEQRDMMLDALDVEMTEAMDREEATGAQMGGEPEGKAPSNSGAAPTP